MAGSYKSIDYRVRPAKSIERKMLADSFRRLVNFRDPADYIYIGMGSLYFSDFSLFHRSIGFKSMVSIEDCTDPTVQRRFQLNLPFGHIHLEFGRAGAVLQRRDSWKSNPAVIWLDYDGQLSIEVIRDAEYVAANCASGTMLIVSVNADRLALMDSVGEDGDEIEQSSLNPLQIMSRNIGQDRVPLDVSSKDLSGWGVAKVYRRVVDAAIRRGLNLRPDGRSKYEQLFNFNYSDGAKMLTVGGVIFAEEDQESFEKSKFERMEFVRGSDDVFKIDPPKLTYSEMRAINSRVADLPVPPSDVVKYQQTYRYFPHFIEAEVG